MISSIISRLVILVFGTLYPAYASYKAVRTKNLKEYVKWMMYWIVFALFTCMETFTDVFLSWFPFYYEVKIVLVLWLLSPATKGSSILYRKFVHPALCRREQEIDEYIAKAKDQGYHTVLNLGTKGVNYATTVIMQTAIKGGGGIVQQIRKSYSLSDLSECEPRPERARAEDEADDVLAEPQLIRRNTVRSGYNTRRSASESNSRPPIYFPEVDVDMRAGRTRVDEPDLSHIKSSEDISSGYSSADNSASLARTASVGAGARMRARQTRTAVTAIKRPQAAEDSEVIIEELHDDDSFDYSNMPALLNVHSPLYLSQTDPPYIYQYVGDQVRIIQILADQSMNFTQEKVHLKEHNDSSIDENNTQSKHDEQSFEDNTAQETDQNNNDNNLDESKSIFDLAIESSITEIEKETVVSIQFHNISIGSEQVDKSEIEVNKCIVEKPETITSVVEETVSTYSMSLEPEETAEVKTKPIDSLKSEETEEMKTNPVGIVVNQENVECASLESTNDNETPESDDEASFGTPEGSPKTKRKTMKGKYGKGKAPAPPPPVISNVGDNNDAKDHDVVSITSKESLADILDTLPNASFRETGAGLSRTVNPISEKKRRHKSKSPKRPSKSSSSGLGKLLQLPGKFAFWNKSDKTKGDNISTSSEDSRRSSTLEKADEFQSCAELNRITTEKYQDPVETVVATIADDQISFKDASDGSSEVITQDIMDKSDALQKLIEAKIESHPEYKYTTIDQEIPTTSKSTEVL